MLCIIDWKIGFIFRRQATYLPVIADKIELHPFPYIIHKKVILSCESLLIFLLFIKKNMN